MPSTRRIFITIISLFLLSLALWISGVKDVFTRLTSFPLWVTGSLLVLLLANLFLVSLRFWRVLAHFGVILPWKVASRASISGHVAGLFMISLFGQVMGRQLVLRNYQVQAVVISGLAAYERTILAIVSGVLGVYGTIYLFGYEAIAGFIERISITEILFASIGGGLLSFWLGRSRFEKTLSAQVMTWSNATRFAEITGISLVGQLLVLACFVLGITAINPEIEVIHLFSAAAVISFAATLPITVNGWGVREIVAVYVLGKLGISPTDAVAVSILVGLCSTVVIILIAPFSLKMGTEPMAISKEQKVHPVIEIEKITAWCLGMAIAVAVFFQAYISLPGGVVNLNLADPFAILALAAVSLHALFSRQLPNWRLNHFNLALGLISLLLSIGFVRGWFEIGITQWALGGRLLGWLVLLGYLSAGYLVMAHAGSHGLRRLAETTIATASVVVVVQVFLRLLDNWGVSFGMHIPPNFEGYSGNRNAFAFQLLSTITLLLGYSAVYAKHRGHYGCIKRSFLSSILLAILLAGLFWTGSRAGIAVGVMLIFGTWLSKLANRQIVGWAVVFAVVLWLAVWLAGSGLAMLTASLPTASLPTASVQSEFSSDLSNNERLATFTHAITLWRDSPFFGAGLGVFIEKSSTWSSSPVVIHSTPLWILAEFGLLGLSVLGWIFFIVSRHALMFQKSLPTRHALLMLLFVFAVFSLVHEIFYQRILWLLLGVLLAKPFSYRVPA